MENTCDTRLALVGKEELNRLAMDTEGFSGSDISYYVSVNLTLGVSMSPK